MKIISLMTAVLLVTTLNIPAAEGGFGCPGNEYECDRHCRDDVQCRGGYCDAFKLGLVCTCTMCDSGSTKPKSTTPVA